MDNIRQDCNIHKSDYSRTAQLNDTVSTVWFCPQDIFYNLHLNLWKHGSGK